MSRKFALDEVKNFAKLRKYTYLSNDYTRSSKQERWRCPEMHEFEMTTDKFKNRKQGCPTCYNLSRGAKRRRWSIERIKKEVSEPRNGQILSNNYVNLQDKLEWKCSEGHTWSASLSNVHYGKTWCPICSNAGSTAERIVRGYFEHFLGTKFQKTKNKSWLNGLELDGYNDNLKLAFEYNGFQHYQETSLFGHTFALSKQQRSDSKKKKILRNNGIRLIVIHHRIKYKNLGKYIHGRLVALGLVEQNVPVPTVDEIGPFKQGFLDEAHDIAKTRGGACLSKSYVDGHTKLKFRCEFEHTWNAILSKIRRGGWCPYCSGNIKRTLEDAQRLAELKGGKCLNKHYINSRTPLKWRCANGHTWNAVFDSIKRGSWCRECWLDSTKIT